MIELLPNRKVRSSPLDIECMFWTQLLCELINAFFAFYMYTMQLYSMACRLETTSAGLLDKCMSTSQNSSNSTFVSFLRTSQLCPGMICNESLGTRTLVGGSASLVHSTPRVTSRQVKSKEAVSDAT